MVAIVGGTIEGARLVLVALLAVVLIGGCVSNPRSNARIGSEGAAYLRRAADNIDQAADNMDRAFEHLSRALAMVADAWPELHVKIAALGIAVADRRTTDDALLRAVGDMLRAVADGSPPLPSTDLLVLVEVFRDVAANARQVSRDAAAQLETYRVAEGRGSVGSRAFDELAFGELVVKVADAMKVAAVNYDAVADYIERAAATSKLTHVEPSSRVHARFIALPVEG